MDGQLDLFGAPRRLLLGPAALGEEEARSARELPDTLHLGTSSWSFPGWTGLVYDREASAATLARHGLTAYARHPLLSTVGLDRPYYAPLAADAYAALAEQVPPGFRFLVKAHEDLTIARFPRHPRYGARAGEASPRFLDPAWAVDRVVGPIVEGLGERAGPILFQLAPQPPEVLGPTEAFAERLQRFLEALPRGPVYAVEIRNRGLLGGHYAAALWDGGAVHCFTVHPTMPDPLVQLARLGELPPGPVVCRWMLQHGFSYAAAKDRYAPFDRIVDEDIRSRERLAELVVSGLSEDRDAYVIVNNKAEGSAPLSVFRLAAAIRGALRGDG